MSRPEQRLRERLDLITTRVDPDVDRHLHQSLRLGHRRRVIRRIGVVAVAALGVALFMAGSSRLSDRENHVPVTNVTPSATIEPSPTTTASELIGTWSTRVTRPGVGTALAADGLETWAEAFAGPPYPPLPADLELTLDGESYTIADSGGDVLKAGSYSVDGTRLALVVDPNGVTVLEAAIDGDRLALTLVSNSTQPYPPDTPPEEAVQRVLFTSAPFTRV